MGLVISDKGGEGQRRHSTAAWFASDGGNREVRGGGVKTIATLALRDCRSLAAPRMRRIKTAFQFTTMVVINGIGSSWSTRHTHCVA